MRLLAVVLIAWLLLPGEVGADERGARRQWRDNRACAQAYALRAPRGLTIAERAHLARRGCVETAPGVWRSGRVYQA